MDSLDCGTDRFAKNGPSARSSPSSLGLQVMARSCTRFSWRVWICAWIFTLWPCLVFLLPLDAFAQGQLEVSPNKVELCAGRTRLVRVTATNLGPASAVQLNWKADTNAIVEAESLPQGITRDATAMSTWLLRLSAPPTGAISGVIHLYAKGAATAKTDARLAATSLEVKPPDWSAAFPATLELHSAWETINEKQKAIVVAAVSNTSSATLRVNRVFLVDGGVPFVAELLPPTLAGSSSPPWVMQPGETRTWTFLLRVGEQNTPPIGKHQLVFQVDASTTVDGCERNGSLVAHRDLGFAVIGESAILTALAIPSFLLVPGFLCLLVPSIFWRFNLRPSGKESLDDFPLKPTSPEFWTVGVTLSILGYWLAPLLTGRSDMFITYRFEDVVWTWMASLLVGTLAYLGYVLWVLWRRRVEAARKRLFEFTDEDKNRTPIDILEKLGRIGISLKTMEVEVDLEKAGIGSGKTNAYVLKRSDTGTWIAPRIELRIDDLDDTSNKTINTACDALDAGKLARALKIAGNPDAIALWEQSKLVGPRRVLNDCIKDVATKKLFTPAKQEY